MKKSCGRSAQSNWHTTRVNSRLFSQTLVDFLEDLRQSSSLRNPVSHSQSFLEFGNSIFHKGIKKSQSCTCSPSFFFTHRKLSDVTKDGALSLSEFCTAMHLVVLRRNNIALPNQLPPLLDPVNMFSNGSSSSGSGGVTQVDGGDKVVEGPSQTWIEFVESPTGSVTSPGPRPVNFDFQRAQVEQNPRILHPVALRLTPESQSVDLASGPISLPPCGPNLGNSLINAASNNTISNLGGKKEPPPPPPPRPYRGHTRSSSLDLNQLGIDFSRSLISTLACLTLLISFFSPFQGVVEVSDCTQ